MNPFWTSRLAVLVLIVAVLSAKGAQTNELIAFSLKRAEQNARASRNHLSTDTTLGMTDVIGFVLDPAENDVIFLGRRRPKGMPLGPDEIAQLFRAASVSGLTGPGVSLEPAGKDSFKAVYFGGKQTSRNWIGAVSYSADFSMKQIGLGIKPSGVESLATYADRMVTQMNSSRQQWKVLSRFWFVPSYLPMISTNNMWLLKRAQVAVLVENISAEIGGQQQTNYVDEAAKEFAADFVRRLKELTAKHVEFADMQAMMGSLQVAAILLQHGPSDRLDYWRKSYRPISKDCPTTAPVLRRSIQTSWGQIEVHGGVRAAGLAIRLAHNDVGALKETIFRARPADAKLAAWRVSFDENFLSTTDDLLPDQREAAKLFVEANRLRELRRFDEAAREFKSVADIVPDAVEARFLSAVCHREALVASARINELEQPVDELRALSAQYPNFPQIRYEWAVSLSIIGHDAEAVSIFEGLLEQLPDYTSALHGLGMSYYRLGNREKALSYLSQFVKESDRNRYSAEAQRILAELSSAPKEPKSVQYESGLYSCLRPSTWKVLQGSEARRLLSGTTASEHIDVAFLLPRNPDCNIVISVAPYPTGSVTKEQVEKSIPKIELVHQSHCQDYHRIEATPVEIHGVVGVRFVFTKQRLGTTFKQCVTTLVYRSKSFTITCTAPERDFDAMWKEAFVPANDIRFPTL